MKALVTGSNGTLGSVLCKTIRDSGGEAIGWDRNQALPGDTQATESLIREHAPDVIFHTALPSKSTGMENEGEIVNEKWTADIARCAAVHNIVMIFTSSVMVYTNKAVGPFRPDTPPDETEGYGHFKLMGEKAAREANPAVRIARLGWQIGSERGTNNMVHYLLEQQENDGEIRASSLWYPATSFLQDTSQALINIAALDPGLYHIDSNCGWNYYEIVCALNKKHGGHWNVVKTEDFSQNQQMEDPRPQTASLAGRFDF